MPLSIIVKALEAFPQISFINAFGQTETAATITMLSPQYHVISGSGLKREKKLRRLTSIDSRRRYGILQSEVSQF
jgi:hypothetical protein